MEIRGAAYATVLARVIELALVLWENRKKNEVCIRWKYLIKPDVILKYDFKKDTSPVLANELLWGYGFTMFSVIMGHMGNNAVAANSVANIVKNIIACVCFVMQLRCG